MASVAAPPAAASGDRCVAIAVAPGMPALALARSTLVEVVFEPIECPLPGATGALRGIIALRGALLPAFDLAAWLGLGAQAASRVVAIGRGERAAALLAGGEPRVVEVFDAHDAAPPPPALAPFVRAARDADGTPLWRFDHEAWFAVAARPPETRPETAARAAEATP
ncbi:MAG: chemotaxis protein CheW [Xanthomonadaceae bacterium]|jgi:chemotaxis signal transduction protein|nr:chemotaxis protein CheW [Xanthomonadaceae bacterium]